MNDKNFKSSLLVSFYHIKLNSKIELFITRYKHFQDLMQTLPWINLSHGFHRPM